MWSMVVGLVPGLRLLQLFACIREVAATICDRCLEDSSPCGMVLGGRIIVQQVHKHLRHVQVHGRLLRICT